MLEELLIFTRGGLVLWSLCQAGAPGKGSSPVDALIRCCLLEERPAAADGTHGAYTVRWTFHNGLGLVFAAVYHKVLQLLYVDDLLAAVRKEFARVHYSPKRASYPEFNEVFRQLHLEAEKRAHQEIIIKKKNPKQDAGGNLQPVVPGGGDKNHADESAKGGTSDGDDGDFDSSNNGSSIKEDEIPQPSPDVAVVVKGNNDAAFDREKLQQQQRKNNHRNKHKEKIKPAGPKPKPKPSGFNFWNRQSDTKLDYSANPSDNKKVITGNAAAAVKNQGKSQMDREDDGPCSQQQKHGWWFSSMFQSIIVGNNKDVAHMSDLQPALKALKDRLMTKNVAEEIAEKLCESVAASLVGKKLGSFTTISSTAQAAMEDALLRILTPRRSIDILKEVHDARNRGRPYVVVFVGVNGVGKSTNLAKVAYWLLQHDLSVTLAACDTFRSGAVEQLRTHACRLDVPLFEKGYERDPAVVAREAIREACRNKSDVVLVDTAGRMQDNEPLMRALSKLINLNTPDLLLFVGEALVGNDAVDQLTKFNQKLADLSPTPTARLIDGILLTKFDTIDDKVGAALSMVYTSGAPVMFVGCGQSYTDLKKLNVKSIVKTLLM
ncbi:hypothetical protein PR202_ga08067 [Eleusine coracana subsp. coracana]|uniref:SRP54-type proteins GTP-binding domain-containing protein n=1 Tax=Eleusine coracana subsp. coracana TaxID=191504 RepID=A0AAV5C1S3_ELECO|nr:hypothetical protein PR202_ga08067 [Eleusine coracana subsp. coracana]